MNFKSTLISAALLASLGSWYYFYEVKGKPERDKLKADAKLVFKDLNPLSIQEVLIRRPTGDLALKKNNGTWQMMQPLNAVMDQEAMDSMVEAFRYMKNEETVDESGAGAVDFGLGPGAPVITFASSSSTVKAISFGIDNPTGQYAYAQVQGEKPVFLVALSLKNSVMKEVKDFRDKKVWSFESADVSKIRSSFGKGLTLEKGKDGLYSLIAPSKAPGDQDPIKSWINSLKNLRIDSFADDHLKDPGKYGLANSSAKITVEFGPKTPSQTLIQGKKLDGNKGRYYMLQGGHAVFTLADYNSSTLEKKAEELAKKPDPTPVPAAVTSTAKK